MKKLLVLALTLCTLTGFAQKDKSDKKKDLMERLAKRPSPEERAEIQTKQMALRLDLSDKQQTQVQELLLAHYKDSYDKIDIDKTPVKDMTQEERQKMRIARLDSQIELKASMKTILDDTQYAKYSQMMERKMQKGKKRGKRRN
ncbi:MAG: hypothetical protein HKP48_11955 [Winogradskyella sp.]|uniref:hypothetical protein n=1 Tax=Winogradskyella sp. TaxID=1883156 RepID=UPI0017BC3412|nr:hypothetical protein [Winogradskyella sp.]MBT8246112.1 DUF4890 domain-containing protein [Winogradskyella sp.]NNK23970.1 hypothetical protein [Winogradskyella sp.]